MFKKRRSLMISIFIPGFPDRGCNEVVAAGMADLWQGIVLAENSHGWADTCLRVCRQDRSV